MTNKLTKEELKAAFKRNVEALKELGLSPKQIGYLTLHGEQKLATQHINGKAFGAKGVKRADIAATSLLLLLNKHSIRIEEISYDEQGRLICAQVDYSSPEPDVAGPQGVYKAQSDLLIENGCSLLSIASAMYLGDTTKNSYNRVTSKRSGLVAVTKADASLMLLAGLVNEKICSLKDIDYDDAFNALIAK